MEEKKKNDRKKRGRRRRKGAGESLTSNHDTVIQIIAAKVTHNSTKVKLPTIQQTVRGKARKREREERECVSVCGTWYVCVCVDLRSSIHTNAKRPFRQETNLHLSFILVLGDLLVCGMCDCRSCVKREREREGKGRKKTNNIRRSSLKSWQRQHSC